MNSIFPAPLKKVITYPKDPLSNTILWVGFLLLEKFLDTVTFDWLSFLFQSVVSFSFSICFINIDFIKLYKSPNHRRIVVVTANHNWEWNDVILDDNDWLSLPNVDVTTANHDRGLRDFKMAAYTLSHLHLNFSL